jgi:signal transduction histidine kinase
MTPAADRSEVLSDVLAAGLPASVPEPLVAGIGATAPGWQVTPYAALTFAAAVVAVTFAAAMWRSERQPGTVALLTLALGAAWWSLLYGLELSSTTLAGTLLFARLAYLGIVVVPVSWFAFALAYTGHGHHLRPSTVGALASPAVLAAALPWTSGASDLFWASTSLAYGGPGVLLAVEYGPAFWLWSTYSYVLLGVGTVLLLRSVPLDARLFRRQTALLVVGVAAPFLSNLTYLLRIGGMTLDATPLGFVVSALALGAGFRRYRLLDVHPAARAVARGELVERMSESVVVLNDEGRIVDVNPQARAVLRLDEHDVVGTALDSAAPELAAIVDETDRPNREFTTGDPPRHFEVRVSTLRGNHGRSVGRLVVLHDVTERRRREHHIAVLNRVLRHDLNNDIAVVEGYAELLAANPGNDEYAEVIAERAAEMADLLGRVRDVELALDSGSVPLSRVDIVPVIEEQVDGARRAHPEATFETDLPASEEVYAIDLVHSVVDNLVENAVEHNDGDDPYVGVSVGRETECGRSYVTVRVADDGPAIPEPDRRVLVGDEGARLEEAGGLGLWLVNWIVSESGGEVVWEPNEPRGNVVVLRLPSTEPEPSVGGDGDPSPRRSARRWTHGGRSRPTSTSPSPQSPSVRRCATTAGP